MEHEMYENIAREAFEDELEKIAKGGVPLSASLTPGGMGTLTGKASIPMLKRPAAPPVQLAMAKTSMLEELQKIAKKGLPPALKAYLEKKKKGGVGVEKKE